MDDVSESKDQGFGDPFQDDLLSPVSEEKSLPGMSPQTESLGPIADIDSCKSMENIMLESTIMDESIDLGSMSNFPQSTATLVSVLSDENLTADVSESFPVSTEDVSDIAESEADTRKVAFDVGDELVADAETEDKAKEVKDYFKFAGDAEEDVFAVISASQVKDEEQVDVSPEVPSEDTKPEVDMAGESEHIGGRPRHMSVSKEEEVEFEEMKGDGLKPTMSTRNLTKFFVDDGSGDMSGSDTEGKSFFDTFTASSGQSPSAVSASPQLTPSCSHDPTTPEPSLSAGPSSLGYITPVTNNPPLPATYARQTSSESDNARIEASVHLEDKFSSLDLYGTPPSSLDTQEDPFCLSASERDRRRDAWIPTDATRHALQMLLTSPPGTYTVPPEQHTHLALIMTEPQGDPVRDLVMRFMGEQEAGRRSSPDIQSADEAALIKLMESGDERAALNLTSVLLTQCGQGLGAPLSRHSPFSLRVWMVRLCLLVKLRLFTAAESECQSFGGLDSPDLYYEYYQELYPGRRGCMVPFELRVLHAELSQYVGRAQETLDRLHYLLATVNKILSNLDCGLAEDGSVIQIKEDSRKASKELWTLRKSRLLYSLGNCALNIKDFKTAILTYEMLLEVRPSDRLNLLSGIGRVFLQMGDGVSAQEYFDRVSQESDPKDKVMTCRNLMNKGFLALEQNQFSKAEQLFENVTELDPSNAVAQNNVAVCALYQGHLKSALQRLEGLVHSDPATHLHDGLLVNLCTLYELESSRAMHKKQTLLDLVNKHRGDGFNVAALKMT